MKPYFLHGGLIISNSSGDFFGMLFKISLTVDALSGQQGAQQANIINRFGYLDWKTALFSVGLGCDPGIPYSLIW